MQNGYGIKPQTYVKFLNPAFDLRTEIADDGTIVTTGGKLLCFRNTVI